MVKEITKQNYLSFKKSENMIQIQILFFLNKFNIEKLIVSNGQITVAIFGQYERKYGVTASRLQLAFWFFMSLSLLVSAYTKIIQEVCILLQHV